MKLPSLFAVTVILGFAFSATAQETASNMAAKQVEASDLVQKLSSKDEATAENAAKQIFALGDAAIPLLLSQKENRSCFYGLRALGDWSGGGTVQAVPSCDVGSSQITVEVAALYLISAIFFEDLEFAGPPFLCAISKASKTCTDNTGNSRKRIKKAWLATQDWNKKVEKSGISYLRERNLHPLHEAGLSFFG